MNFVEHIRFILREEVYSVIASVNNDERYHVKYIDSVTLSNVTAYFGITEEDNQKLDESTRVVVCNKEALFRMVLDAVAEQNRPDHSEVYKSFAQFISKSGVVSKTTSLKSLYIYIKASLSNKYIHRPTMLFLTRFHEVLCDTSTNLIYWYEEDDRTVYISSEVCSSFLAKRGLWGGVQDGEFSFEKFVEKMKRWGFRRLNLKSMNGVLGPNDLIFLSPFRRDTSRWLRREIDISLSTVSSSLSR
jgi:hypothetical protein